MRIAVTGTGGRVGRALADRFGPRHEVIELPREVLDLSDPDAVGQVSAGGFDVLLHPAAMTSLEGCLDAPLLARQVNFEATARLARCCRKAGRRMIFFSTDYVLGGDEAGLHAEDEAVDPRSVYAMTKADAEEAVREEGGCVMRVSWVFGPERAAFPDQVVQRALAGESLAAVGDKTSLPCATRDLADWVERVVAEGCPAGILHACQGGGPTSWHGMAEFIVARLVERGELKEPVRVEEQRLDEMEVFRAVRPRHTAMSTARLTDLLGEAPRDWREALGDYVDGVSISR
ncbi:SDR family oxidoreductase [Haloferula rosea]|uniref:dTDP-4-dehydrorhamnose reductase n=1 Tax=Haloferula rosea TaxID=490093 RepID=A0A934RCP1_9BACT|nr:NAD(P)-dependent oxidoreductase [Haloferula rosea]MBK1828263.1 NAD(P)-dependent oxidoreductase [Haloferula rosea]